MDTGLRSTSPRGEYIVTVSSWEVRMSLSGRYSDAGGSQRTGENLLSFEDPNWSLNQARWTDDSTVVLSLRKYPGNHTPWAIDVTVNLAQAQNCGRRHRWRSGNSARWSGSLKRQLEWK
jgi:hypothetical protein